MGRTEQGKLNQKEYIKKYKREHYKTITIKLKVKDDANIIEFLNGKNKSEFIRGLLHHNLD